ncbi:hypothetical protein HYC85_019175 [Camellia sinensis]|uniref:Uncharacterized protein n=1 Tax=Camellia sinensis TaxID=4442 RepID=A0A7J7GL40_CAMSI|nr:hypothetical protein HYC85_019175 [Camellia sinensis]
MGEHTHFYGKADGGESWEIDSFSSNFGFYAGNTVQDGHGWSKYQQEHQSQLFSNIGILDDLYCDILTPPTKLASVRTENLLLDESKKEKPCPIPLASLGILSNSGVGLDD